MPRQDRTGPQGQGPMTGRGMGPCGLGLRRGGGYGIRRFISPKNEIVALTEEQKILEEELKAVKEELETLKKES